MDRRLPLGRRMTATFRGTRETLERFCGIAAGCFVLVLLASLPSAAQDAATPQGPDVAGSTPPITTQSLLCGSKAGERTHCKAMTSAGVALVKWTYSTVYVLGKSSVEYDTSNCVSDGGSGEYVKGDAAQNKDVVTKGP